MSSTPKLRVTTPVSRDTWHTILAQDSNALISQTPAWIDAICTCGPYEDVTRLYEAPDGRQFVLPLLRHKGRPHRLTTIASTPHGWGMGGIVATGPVYPQDIAAIFKDLVSQNYLRFSVRPNPLTADLWSQAQFPYSQKVERLSHIIDLRKGYDYVWEKRFTKRTRKSIRRGIRANLTIECDTTGKLLPVYYDLHMTWVENRARDRGLPPALMRIIHRRREPWARYEQVVQKLKGTGQIWVVRYEGQPVAASIELPFGKHVVSWRGVNDRRYANKMQTNEFLLHNTIQAACQAGCEFYHLGESGGVKSLMYFKERFGADPYHYAEYVQESFPITAINQRFHAVFKGLEKMLVRRAQPAAAAEEADDEE